MAGSLIVEAPRESGMQIGSGLMQIVEGGGIQGFRDEVD